MEYYLHDLFNKETIYFNLNISKETFADIVYDFVENGLSTIDSEIGFAKVHPADTYNHRVGRAISKQKKIESHITISSITSTKWETIFSIVAIVNDKPTLLEIIKYNNSGKLIVQRNRCGYAKI